MGRSEELDNVLAVAYFYGGAVTIHDLMGSLTLYTSAFRVMKQIVAAKQPQRAPALSEAPPGFTDEIVTEVITYQVRD